MFTALTLSMALGAPVPADTPPVPVGVAPTVMELKPGADGKVTVTIRRQEKVNVGANAINPGGAAPAVITRVRTVAKQVALDEVKDLTITTADGKKVSTEDAMKKIGEGAIVVVSSDGKPVSPAFLKIFKDDTLILASPELIGNINSAVTRPGVIRPLPIQIQPGGVQVLPIKPGNIQIQIAPAVLPANPPAPPQNDPPKNQK